jgi:hypothetical protein
MVLNSLIFVVIEVKALIEIIPIIKQIKLEMKARINQRSNAVIKSVAIAINFTLNFIISDENNLKLLATHDDTSRDINWSNFSDKPFY